MKTSTLYLGALVGAFVAVACDPSEPGGVSDTDPADLSEVDEPADGSDAANVEVDTDSDSDYPVPANPHLLLYFRWLF